MNKKIEDYLHLYIGCEAHTGHGKVQIVGVHIDNFNGIKDAVVLNGNVTHRIPIIELKLILRPLSDINFDEAKILFSLPQNAELVKIKAYPRSKEFDYKWKSAELPNNPDGFSYSGVGLTTSTPVASKHSPEKTKYLLDCGFDIFGLIEAGLAIEKNPEK